MREYQVLFFTHTGAIRFQRSAGSKGFACTLMPVPRVLSSNCSVSAQVVTEHDLLSCVDDQIEAIYERVDSKYIALYSSD